MIGDEVTVTVLGIRHGQVRLGIDAPDEVKILREELIDRQETEAEMKNGNR